MAQFTVPCCMPDGSCVSVVAEGNPVPLCEAMGGVPRTGYLLHAACGFCDICQEIETPGSPHYICIGSTGFCTACGDARCNYGDGQCDVLNFYDCVTAPNYGNHQPTIPNCPLAQFVQAYLLPMIHRAFPYWHSFYAPWKGKNPDGSPFKRFHAFDYLWWGQGGGIADEPKNMGGRLVLDRVYGCKSAEGRLIPGIETADACKQANGGSWEWTGRIMSRPSANFIVPDLEDCNKYPGHPGWRKNLTLFGFWFPIRKFCVDPETLLTMPEYRDQLSCENNGGYWQAPGNEIRPPLWVGSYRQSPSTDSPGLLDGMKVSMNYTGSNEYRWFAYLPVLPLSEFPGDCCVGGPYSPCVPYCGDPDAPAKFPFYDTRTYEMPCYTQDWAPDEFTTYSGFPYINNRELGQGQSAIVQAGIRGCVGYSPGDAEVANLRAYCSLSGPAGCPQADMGCDSIYCEDAMENIIRKFHGYTDQRKYVWEADTQGRGWWVSYWTTIKAWFAQDSFWTALTGFRPPQRWACWYEGVVECRFHGDTSDAAFNAFIMSHDSGYGIDFAPRYSACNDPLMRNLGMPTALADLVYPPENAQDGCNDPETPLESGRPPCLRSGNGYGHWYRPDYGAPLPEQMLIHETARKRYTKPDKSEFAIQYGWARIGFASLQPNLQVIP